MKRNVIAILLSISMITGAFGASPLHAAEVSSQEAITESEQDAEGMTSGDETTASEDEETVEEAALDSSSKSTDEQVIENC